MTKVNSGEKGKASPATSKVGRNSGTGAFQKKGYQPTQDPGKIRPPKGGTGESKPKR